MKRLPRRREVLAGGAGALSLAILPRPARAGAAVAIPAGDFGRDVDVHCHTFCSADLPIVGFVAHYIPGLTELSRFVTRWPEVVVRALVGVVAKLPNAVAPTGDEELASLRALLASPAKGPVAGVVRRSRRRSLDELLAALAREAAVLESGRTSGRSSAATSTPST